MLKNLTLSLLAVLCLSLQQAYSQKELIYSEVQITIPKSKVASLQKAGIDIDHAHYNEEKQVLTTVLNEIDIKLLKKFLFKYKIRTKDLVKEFQKKNNPAEFYKHSKDPLSPEAQRLVYDAPNGLVANNFTTPAAFTSGSMGGYYTLTEIIQKINNMVSAYPTLVRKDTIGYTHQSRPIIAVKISSNVTTESGKPEVLYTGMHHSREPMGMMNLIFFMQYLLENYATNSLVQELVNNRSMYFIPCVNPDGYQRNVDTNPSGGGLHRKNRRVNANTSNMGVDLNRNYSYGWNDANGGSSTQVHIDSYRGPSAASEPETQAMMAFINARNFKFALNYHAFGEYWINSFCVTPAPADALTALESKIIETAGHLMTRTNYYLVGTPIETVGYNARGSSDDWFMAGSGHSRIYCFSPEVGPEIIGNTAGSFWPVASRIIPLAKEVMFSNFQAAYVAGSYGKLEDRSSVAVNSATGSFGYTLRRLGLTNAPYTVSIVPLQNIQSVGPAQNISLTNTLDTVMRSITYQLSPGIQMGQKIRFLWQVTTGGITLVDTITKVYSPTVVFSDNMDAGAVSDKWNVTSTWNYTSNSRYEGTRALATNTATNYAGSVNSTATIRSTLNLDNSNSAYLSFWVRYRSQTGVDLLRIQAANNGNAAGANWQSLPSLHTIAETKTSVDHVATNIGGVPALSGIQDYWVREIVDLTAYAGQTNVGIRFQFQSNNAINHNGFFIDNVEVFKSMSSPLPVIFNSIKATAQGNNVLVKWEAQTNEQHDYFEVEHSEDGINFTSVGFVYEPGFSFSFKHTNPVNGINYYRVKGKDKDGKYNYTPIASVRVGMSERIQLYPNPAKDVLQLKTSGLLPGKYTVEVVTTTGQQLITFDTEVLQGQQHIKVPVEKLSAGTYYLQVKQGPQNIFSESFVKINY